MAVSQVSAAVDRLRDDSGFRTQYCQDPDGALDHYRLTRDELQALKTGDGFELEMMGLGRQWLAFVEALCGPHPGP